MIQLLLFPGLLLCVGALVLIEKKEDFQMIVGFSMILSSICLFVSIVPEITKIKDF